MSAPTTLNLNNNDTPPETRRVTIAGAGPSGLLLQALLHHRNKAPNARVNYDVTMIESRPDLGQLDKEELNAYRIWMIGLAGHGLEAVRSLPGLYENYLTNVGIQVTEGNIFMGRKKDKHGIQWRRRREWRKFYCRS